MQVRCDVVWPGRKKAKRSNVVLTYVPFDSLLLLPVKDTTVIIQ